jgi:hypothetical protein
VAGAINKTNTMLGTTKVTTLKNLSVLPHGVQTTKTTLLGSKTRHPGEHHHAPKRANVTPMNENKTLGCWRQALKNLETRHLRQRHHSSKR